MSISIAIRRANPQQIGVDKLDIRLLNILQKNSRLTADQLAEQLPLSSSAITRRIKRLREDGAIMAEVAILPAKMRDKRLTALINISSSDTTQRSGPI